MRTHKEWIEKNLEYLDLPQEKKIKYYQCDCGRRFYDYAVADPSTLKCSVCERTENELVAEPTRAGSVAVSLAT